MRAIECHCVYSNFCYLPALLGASIAGSHGSPPRLGMHYRVVRKARSPTGTGTGRYRLSLFSCLFVARLSRVRSHSAQHFAFAQRARQCRCQAPCCMRNEVVIEFTFFDRDVKFVRHPHQAPVPVQICPVPVSHFGRIVQMHSHFGFSSTCTRLVGTRTSRIPRYSCIPAVAE